MAYDGSLKFDTKIDQSGFESGLKKLGGFVKKSAKVAAAAVTTATTALSGFAAAGVKYNAQLETYNQTLTTLLGSESKAQKAFEQIKKDAARTPFDVASLTQANSMLISTGMNAEDSRKDIMNLANAVAATGGGSDGLSRMAQNMQQIKNLGKASAVDIKQFAMAGINIYGILADYLGITADEAAKLDVTYEQLSGALEYAASAQGKYTGALEKQSQTVKGQLSTLKDNAMSFLGDITKGMSVSLKDEAIPLINGYMDRLKEAFSRDGLNGLVSEFGDVLGDLVGKVAEQAPKIVEQGVNLIKSFAGGIVKNKDKLISAAKEIVKTIVDALISLLPKEVQKPVKDALQAIAKAFNSNDFKTLLRDVVKLFTELLKVVANLAKTALPPLIKVVGFAAKNFKILLPLLIASYAAWKSFLIIQKITKMMAAYQAIVKTLSLYEAKNVIALMASNGALSIKEMLVGILTGKVTLATAAQAAWNAVMAANPIGLVIAAAAGLITVTALLTSTLKDNTEEEQRFYDGMLSAADAAQRFHDGAANAKSALADFNTETSTLSRKSQELVGQIDTVEDQISQIQQTASEERRAYTQEEINRLNELNNKLIQLQHEQEKQQALSMERQLTTMTRYEQNMSESRVHEIQKGADEAYNAHEKAATDLYNAQMRSLDSLKQLEGETDAEFEKRKSGLAEGYLQQKQNELTAAAEVRNGIYQLTLQKYAEQNQLDAEHLAQLAEINNKVEVENQRHTDALAAASENMGNGLVGGIGAITDEARRHAEEMERLNIEAANSLDDAKLQALGVLTQMALEIEAQGGTVDDNTRAVIDTFLNSFSGLPEDVKGPMRDTFAGILDEMKDANPDIFTAAEANGDSLLNGLKNALGIASPSKETWKVGEFADEGLKGGVKAKSGDVANEGTNLVKLFVARFDTLRHQMQNIGVNAINGIIEGLRSAEGRLMEKARNLANSIATTMKKALDIRSPSRVFRNQIGRNIPLGVAEGIDDEQPTVDRKVLRFGDRLVSRMQASIWAARMRNAISTDVSRMAFQAAGLNSTTTNNSYNNSQSFNFYTPTATPYEVATAARLAWEVH